MSGFPARHPWRARRRCSFCCLQPYAAYVSDCWLSIEHKGTSPANAVYEVHLFIGTIKNRARRVGRCIRDSAEAAIQCAFNIALRALEILSLHPPLKRGSEKSLRNCALTHEAGDTRFQRNCRIRAGEVTRAPFGGTSPACCRMAGISTTFFWIPDAIALGRLGAVFAIVCDGSVVSN